MIYIFTGPTLSAAEASAHLEATYLPPVSQGDVYRVARARPWAIGIIDGYFERVPAVWHKEILWAMSQGVHVFGAASMGALRAAELANYGMVGVGAIFEAVRAGHLRDDDEVAVFHGPAELGYVALTDACVDIRATLTRAHREGVLTPETAQALVQVTKDTFYGDRSFAGTLEAGARVGLPRAELDAFEAWLPTGRVHQKRDDAIAMLSHIAAHGRGPKTVRYHFEYTDTWDQIGRRPLQTSQSTPSLLTDELRLLGPDAYAEAIDAALLRALADEEAERHGVALAPERRQEIADAWRVEQGLAEPETLAAWMADHGTDARAFGAMIDREARLEWVRTMLAGALEPYLHDYLRATGTLAALDDRASRKQAVLTERGLTEPGVEATGLTPDALLEWFFERVEAPPTTRAADWARRVGCADVAALLRVAAREHLTVLPRRR